MGILQWSKSKKQAEESSREIDTTALVYALKTSKIEKDELIGINNQALSILNAILNNERVLASEIERVETKGENLYASIQVVLEAADVLNEYTKKTNSNINTGLDEINTIIEKISLFTQSTSRIMSFIKPFEEYSKKIGSISDIIFNIAEMTESAARNAGIKAYHAGEYGRGFEVIADRMLLLANQTFELTKKIPKGIDKIQSSTEKIIENISTTEESASNVRESTDKLNQNLKNIEMNTTTILETSSKIKEFVSLQNKNKDEISQLNEQSNMLIEKSVASGERLSTVVKTQSDIKSMLSNFMEQVDNLVELMNSADGNYVNALISNEIKLFSKIENQLINSRHISDQLINIIDDFIIFNDDQLEFIKSYKSSINSLEDNERMIEEHIEDMEDSLSLLMHAAGDFNNNILKTKENISDVRSHISELTSIFREVSNNLRFIKNTSNELKELSDQTRLLSLYASIEAARAGKYQKSLSVIVTQSKELISKASQASSDINEIVGDMQTVIGNIDSIIDSEMETSSDIETSIIKSEDLSQNITETSTNIKQLIADIFSTLESQSQGRKGILNIYENISLETDKINNRVNELYSLLKKDLTKNEENIEMIQGIKENIGAKFTIEENHEKNIFRMILKDPPKHWMPALVGDAMSNYVLQLIHNGLVKFGRDTNVIPGVAKYWSINEDATEWIFHLRTNVYFHDGTKVTADDVKASFYKAMKSPTSSFINMIKGAGDYINKKNHFIEGIQVIDDYKIKFILDYPYVPFISNLAVTPLSIIKKAMVNYTDEQMMKQPVGCGPFKMHSYSNSMLILHANDEYYDGAPFIDTVSIKFNDEQDTLKMLLDNRIDFTELSSKEHHKLKEDSDNNVKVRSTPSLDLQYIGFNMSANNILSQNREVRQAISYATDKNRYIAETMGGDAIAARGVFPPALPCFNKTLEGYPYNINKARELMEKAGYPRGIDRTFTITCSKTESIIKRAKLLKKMWAEIGIKIKIETMEWANLLDKMHEGKTEIFMMGWAADTGEPDNFLYPLFHSDSHGEGGNDCFYSVDRIDRLIEKSRQITAPEKRNKLYKEIESEIVSDAPMIFMSHNYSRIATRKEIYGYYVHPLHTYPIDVTWKNWREDE
ncbi:MAG: ABC transporter substrate-binding protein [bacterium]